MRKMIRRPTHPGEVMEKDVMPALGLDFDAAAAQISFGKDRFRDFLDGKVDLTDSEAQEMEKAFTFKATLLLNLQKNHRQWTP